MLNVIAPLMLAAVAGSGLAWWMAIRRQGRQQQRQVALESQAAVGHVVAAAPVAVAALDARGAITFWNRAAERIFGMPRGRALGQTLGELLGSPAVDREPGDWPAGEPVEVEAVRADGGELQLAITVVPLPGGVPGDFALYARDVTRAKRAQRAQALLARTAELLESST